MGTSRLVIYNNALMLIGEKFLASLSEDREPRRLLDQVWDNNGVRYCLEQGQWQFAARSQQIDYDPSIDPPFGYQHAFNKPTDWVNTMAVCTDPYLKQPLLQYLDELENWYCDFQTIYVKFVSDDTDYGSDLSIWPASFCDYVDAYFASRIVATLTSDKDKITWLLGSPGDVKGGELGRRLMVAKSRAAMSQATQFPPEGSWVKGRRGSSSTRGYDFGNRGSLTG